MTLQIKSFTNFSNINNRNVRKIHSNDIITTLTNNNIYELLKKHNTNKKNDINIRKRYIDNYIKLILDKENYSELFIFLTLLNKQQNNEISYSTINIILKYLIQNEKYSILINNNLANLDTFPRLDIVQLINEIIISNYNKQIKTNKKFIEVSIQFINKAFLHFEKLGQLSRIGLNTLHTYNFLNTTITVIENSNIYLDEQTVSRLIFIYTCLFNFNLDLQIEYCKNTILNIITRHILLYEQARILQKLEHSSRCNYYYFTKNYKFVLTKNILTQLNIMKMDLFRDLTISNKTNPSKKKMKMLNKKNKHWTFKLFKKVQNLNIFKNIDLSLLSNVKIIDGRNKYYNKYSSEKYNYMDLNKMKYDLTCENYNYTFIIFNSKHYDIIMKKLNSIFINNNLLKIIKGSNTTSNEILGLQLKNSGTYKNRWFIFLFTPRFTDDDLMSIYLKLSIPYASIDTNDNYGKYLDYFKSKNHYQTVLWENVFNLIS